ncbi:unnamed protein product [Euphydryas editha]|uniref:Uncharacterized protein n=1 Tax=Euphydryas editha TaxID=104508 RepID=A0AAU9V1P4_EUPED|nr:unnamed protein product [Euphydryas editha]
MLFQFIGALFLIYILNPGRVSSFENSTEFTVTFYEIKDLDTLISETDSFGLTKQCRNLNVTIEFYLNQEEKQLKHYKNLYRDDLTKLTVIYPLVGNVAEIDLHSVCPISETKDSKKQDGGAPETSELDGKKVTENKTDSKVTKVVLTTLASVALVLVISFLMFCNIIYHVIKTKLQSGSFRKY